MQKKKHKLTVGDKRVKAMVEPIDRVIREKRQLEKPFEPTVEREESYAEMLIEGISDGTWSEDGEYYGDY